MTKEKLAKGREREGREGKSRGKAFEKGHTVGGVEYQVDLQGRMESVVGSRKEEVKE